MLRNVLLGTAAAALFASAAVAADLPAYEPAPAVAAPVPSFTWSGLYLGAQAGYGWGNTDVRGLDPKGLIVGGFAGYNVQLDGSPVVFGVETDFNFADVDDRVAGGKFKSDWTGATRGRVGYAFERFLVYGAAGVAYADSEVKAFGSKDSKTVYGYTVGGGAEYAVTDNVALRGEYRYTDFGKERYSVAGTSGKIDYDEHRVMGGVSFKFSGW